MESPSVGNQGSSAQANRKTREYIVGGCGILLTLAAWICMVGTGLGAIIFSYFGGTPKNISVDYELPTHVLKGEEFDLVLVITNTGDTDMAVGDIDLDQALSGSILEGAVVLSTEPDMRRDYSIPGIKSFHYDRTIPAGESEKVTFRMQATTVGEYGGSIGVYVGNLSYTLNEVTITITEQD